MINIDFSMLNDTRRGYDPDSESKTLNEYHKLLWQKELPNGIFLDLKTIKGKPLRLLSNNCKNLILSSDSIIHTYSKWKRTQGIISKLSKNDLDEFIYLASTIGGYLVFPSHRVENKPTINASRGMNSKIRDRFDLTLECIRLWYKGVENPLFQTLDRYKDFFKYFNNFKGYIKFFLLDDLVSTDYKKINFWLPFNGFESVKTIPTSFDEYKLYKQNILKFLNNRNRRIKEYSRQ